MALKQYTDEEVTPAEPGGKKQFESGKVNIWREKAADVDTQGTTVVLTAIRPQARDTLRSREIWSAIAQSENSLDPDGLQSIEPPRFHIGKVDDKTGELLQKTSGKYSALPWESADGPKEAFKKLVQSVWDEVEQSNPNPQLDRVFDYYLRMIWQLSLAVPLPYVDAHIFDMPQEGWADLFALANTPKGSARRIVPEDGKTIRKAMALVDPVENIGQFDVYFDNLRLFRPIKFRDLPRSSNALKKPLVFFGKCAEQFEKLPRELSGGLLAFEAYLFWTPKIAPTEHRGALIRIHGSSGTLFDPTFMRYQISEQTRLRQMTCEIFVSEGLDSALNIDRESFNNAHPHAVYITKWLHSALRQLATAQKRLASEAREHIREDSKGTTMSEIQRVAVDLWKQETDDPASQPPAIEISNTGQKSSASAAEGYIFNRAQVIPDRIRANTQKTRARDTILEEKLKAIAQVLASLGLLDAVPKRKQEKLLKAIFEILEAPEE